MLIFWSDIKSHCAVRLTWAINSDAGPVVFQMSQVVTANRCWKRQKYHELNARFMLYMNQVYSSSQSRFQCLTFMSGGAKALHFTHLSSTPGQQLVISLKSHYTVHQHDVCVCVKNIMANSLDLNAFHNSCSKTHSCIWLSRIHSNSLFSSPPQEGQSSCSHKPTSCSWEDGVPS